MAQATYKNWHFWNPEYFFIFQGSAILRGFLMMNIGAVIVLLHIYIFSPTTNAKYYMDIALPLTTPTNHHELSDSQQNHVCNCSNIPTKTSPELKVPNIVHYIWYNSEVTILRFDHLLSMLSVHKILKPDVIYFHTNREPTGRFWEQAKKIPNFKINHREPPTHLFGEPIKPALFKTSHSNVDRVKVLVEYGGIYLDFDTLIIRPMDDLRKYDCTIGLEDANKACGSIIICHKDAPFLAMWLNAFLDDYRIGVWAYNTGQVRGHRPQDRWLGVSLRF